MLHSRLSHDFQLTVGKDRCTVRRSAPVSYHLVKSSAFRSFFFDNLHLCGPFQKFVNSARCSGYPIMDIKLERIICC